MPTYTTPADVSNGTVLSNSLVQNLLGPSGSLNYLYDGIYTGGLECPPIFVLATSASASIANATTTNVVFNTFQYGALYWNGTQINTNVCTTQSLTGSKFFILYQTAWNTVNTAGFRQSTISLTTTNCTADYSSYRATKTPATTLTTTSGTTALVSFVDTANPSSFTLTFSVFQNSGAALNAVSTLMICQLPST